MAARYIVLFAACLQLSLASYSGGSPAFYDYTTAWPNPSYTYPGSAGAVTAWKTPAAYPSLPWAYGLPGSAWAAPNAESAWTTPAQAPNAIYYPSASYNSPGQELYWNSPAPYGIGNSPAANPILPETYSHPWNTPAPVPSTLALPTFAGCAETAGLGALPSPAPAGTGALPSPAPAGLGSLPSYSGAPAGLGALPTYSGAPAGLGAVPGYAPAGTGVYSTYPSAGNYNCLYQ